MIRNYENLNSIVYNSWNKFSILFTTQKNRKWLLFCKYGSLWLFIIVKNANFIITSGGCVTSAYGSGNYTFINDSTITLDYTDYNQSWSITKIIPDKDTLTFSFKKNKIFYSNFEVEKTTKREFYHGLIHSKNRIEEYRQKIKHD